MKNKKYTITEAIRDVDGDYVVNVEFRYNNTTYNHECLYALKKLRIVGYGYTIPYILEIWDELDESIAEYIKNKELE